MNASWSSLVRREPGNMPSPVQDSLGECLAFLTRISDDGIAPPEALRRLKVLQARHPQLSLELVWELEAFTQSHHYDLLIQSGPEATISLSYCPDRGVPWPLRSAHHAPDGHLLHVNGQVVDVATALTTLELSWGQKGLIENLVNLGILQQHLNRRNDSVSTQELQQAMNRFRTQHRLLTRADTLAFLHARGLTQTALERRLEGEVLVQRLRDEVVGDGLEAWFESHRAELDMVLVARLRFGTQSEAATALERLHRDETIQLSDFLALAGEQFLAQPNRLPGPLFTRLRRGTLSAEQAELLFGEHTHPLLPPVRSGDGWELVWVLEQRPAQLDAETRELVLNRRFDEWLQSQRANATITWFWGDAVRMQNFLAGRPVD